MIAIKDKAIRIINDIQLSNSLGVLFSTKRNLFFYDSGTGKCVNIKQKNLSCISERERNKEALSLYFTLLEENPGVIEKLNQVVEL